MWAPPRSVDGEGPGSERWEKLLRLTQLQYGAELASRSLSVPKSVLSPLHTQLFVTHTRAYLAFSHLRPNPSLLTCLVTTGELFNYPHTCLPMC